MAALQPPPACTDEDMSTSSRAICPHHCGGGGGLIFWLSLVNSVIAFKCYDDIQSEEWNKKKSIFLVKIELNPDKFQVTLKSRDISPQTAMQLSQLRDKLRDHWLSCNRSPLWNEQRLFPRTATQIWNICSCRHIWRVRFRSQPQSWFGGGGTILCAV